MTTITPAPVVFIDCETTSLRSDRRAWEIALIRRTGVPGAEDTVHHWMIDVSGLDLGNADPQSLAIGGFYQRHPQVAGNPIGPVPQLERDVLYALEQETRGAVLFGSNSGFDAQTLDPRMRAHGILPSWHYHPQDLPSMARGWLQARGIPLPTKPDGKVTTDDLARACGVNVDWYERHTALGDATMFRDWCDVMAADPGRYDALLRPLDGEDLAAVHHAARKASADGGVPAGFDATVAAVLGQLADRANREVASPITERAPQ